MSYRDDSRGVRKLFLPVVDATVAVECCDDYPVNVSFSVRPKG